MPRASIFASPRLLLPLAALLAALPLILHGNSCGQDLTFHLQSWIDAARQLRHGHYPRWDATAAWNAGEPRFLFYPPLSWLLGALLTLILPGKLIDAAPIAFIFIALLLSGLTFHRLARRFVSPNAALIASALYLANPYMLFNAFERSALAELLAAAWIPLLLLALLRPCPTLGSPAGLPAGVAAVRGIAIPLALLWLTNVPAAIMGSYLLALLTIVRAGSSILTARLSAAKPRLSQPSVTPTLCHPERSAAESKDPPPSPYPAQLPGPFPPPTPDPFRLTLTYLAGTLLGLALPAFYLIPAISERRLIQSSMALIPPLRFQDNFLFAHTPDAAHNAVNHTASLLALTLLLLTAAAMIALLLRRATPLPEAVLLSPETAAHESGTAVILSEDPERATRVEGDEPKDPDAATSPTTAGALPATHAPAPLATLPLSLPKGNLRLDHLPLPPAPTLTLLTLLIAFLLTPLSTPIWRHLPELAFLQFPWRLLTLLAPILALTLALLLDRFFFSPPKASSSQPTQIPSSRPERSRLREREVERPLYFAAAAALLLPLTLSLTLHHLYAQPCDPADTPSTLARNLATHHGTLPTDEYTPTTADNDLLRSDNPGFWLAPLTDPNASAPNTHTTATELNPSIDTDDTPIPLSQTLSIPAPHHLSLNLPHAALLVLNLRAYPNWRIALTHPGRQPSPSAQDRNDGLIVLAVPSGPSALDIAWRRTPDQTLGLAISALALITLASTFRRKAHP